MMALEDSGIFADLETCSTHLQSMPMVRNQALVWQVAGDLVSTSEAVYELMGIGDCALGWEAAAWLEQQSFESQGRTFMVPREIQRYIRCDWNQQRGTLSVNTECTGHQLP